jgi:hypothetical protein
MPVAARPLVDIGDERAIDLDLVSRDVSKHGKRRITCAEIIDGNAHAELPQQRQNLCLKLARRNEGRPRSLR